MRIIAGTLRGRTIKAPKDFSLRPSSERLRGAVFDILTHGIDWPGFERARVLDLFAGTGAYGFEALSRGAVLATFIDHDPTALSLLRQNAKALQVVDAISIVPRDARTLSTPPWTSGAPFDLAFADPPYRSGDHLAALTGLANQSWLKASAIVVVELAAKEPFTVPDNFHFLRERRHGAGRVVFLRYAPARD